MNLIQLLTFTWVGAWVIGESLFPDMRYEEKLQACIFATSSIAYLNDIHGLTWRKMKKVFHRWHSK